MSVAWQTATGSGNGTAVSLTSDTGYFWFFSSNNVEMVIKVVDGRPVNNRFWVFAGGLTDVKAVVTVTDTQTGAVKTYTNPQGIAFLPIQDTNAFPGEPSRAGPRPSTRRLRDRGPAIAGRKAGHELMAGMRETLV